MKKLFYKKPELLAPAGDLHRAKTAVRYGADAVYIGGKSYSLRSRSSNFTLEDIAEICAYAKDYGAHIHVTVNIIPHPHDLDGLADYLRYLESVGVTAIIAASPTVMKLCKEVAPKLEVHCSTQMSVTNAESAVWLKEHIGIDRVVLARECDMNTVKEICDHAGMDTEAFIHGGMCVNYSGRCTLSNRMTLRDANRGGCAQSCRWDYHLYDGDQEVSTEERPFTMGSKDLSAAKEIRELMMHGVSSFKIEGRMKTEYYVASVVSGYRHLIDELYESDGQMSDERMAYHMGQIMRGENRLTWPGFYHEPGLANSMIYTSATNVNVSHDFLATVIDYQDGIATIETRNPIDVGDEIEVLSPQGIRRFTLAKMYNKDGENIDLIRNPMTKVTIEVPVALYKQDILRRAR